MFRRLELHSDLADVYDQLGRVDDALLQHRGQASESGVSGIRLVAFRWAEFTRWVEENRPEEDDPRQLRAQFSADLSRDPSRLVPWPRGRNEPCWCGSGRKYKKCCAAPGLDGSR